MPISLRRFAGQVRPRGTYADIARVLLLAGLLWIDLRQGYGEAALLGRIEVMLFIFPEKPS